MIVQSQKGLDEATRQTRRLYLFKVRIGKISTQTEYRIIIEGKRKLQDNKSFLKCKRALGEQLEEAQDTDVKDLGIEVPV